MTKQEIIDAGISSLYNLIEFIEKPIDFNNQEEQFKIENQLYTKYTNVEDIQENTEIPTNIKKKLIKDLNNEIKELKEKLEKSEYNPYKFKSIVDGRKRAFEVGYNQITQIRQMEDSLGIHTEEEHRKRLQDLVDSTEKLQQEIKTVLEYKIDAESSEDDKVRILVDSKDIAFGLMEQIFNTSETINQKLKDKDAFNQPIAKVDFATARVKNGKNERSRF
ncbi:MAG: hypothetical protein KDC67_10425 [Ignavibacteriae bacterium]|nr:hypothetical protein [Ignavibacteriota bacterium]